MRAFPRICISSTRGGGGKTLLSLGLARAYLNAGYAVKPFKKGPDYIDAAWLGMAARTPATNLDPFFFSREKLAEFFVTTIEKFQATAAPPFLALIEGNRGLYDGLNETGICSTAQVARAIASPVLLCLDCVKATRTIAAIVNGLINFEQGIRFAGVILNRVGSARHETSLRNAVESCTPLKVLGCLPRLQTNPLPERHMGLSTLEPALNSDIETKLNKLGEFVKVHCDLQSIFSAADSLPQPHEKCATETKKNETAERQCNIAIIKDNAFWFYYPENLDALQKAGARLHFITLVKPSPGDLDILKNMDGIYIGGGFPEDFLPEISASPILRCLADCFAAKMPIYAECGGMMLLCKTLKKDGKTWPLAGLLNADIIWTHKPQGLGYVEGRVMEANPWFSVGLKLKAHEFHYSRCQWRKEVPPVVMKLSRGSGAYQATHSYDGVCVNNLWASYAHIFAPSTPEWSASFLRLAHQYRKTKELQKS